MTNDEVMEQKNKAMNRAMASLVEHFDNFVILSCHTLDDGCTGRVFKWQGNPYTCLGLAESFKETVKGVLNDTE